MITGDLIRLKNLVDDCVRVARGIQREAERLTAGERAHLVQHIQNTAPQFEDILTQPSSPSSLSETAKKG